MNWKDSMETYTLPYAKEIAGESLLWRREFKLVLCAHLEGWDGVRWREAPEERTHVYVCLACVAVWRKPSQYLWSSYPLIKNKYFLKKEMRNKKEFWEIKI